MKRTLAFLMVMVGALTLTIGLSRGGESGRFDAAVLKVAAGNGLPGCRTYPGLLDYNCRGTTKEFLIMALVLAPFQVSSGEAHGPVFTVHAKVGKPTPENEKRAMLLPFLIERGLRYHSSKVPMSAWVLTVPDQTRFALRSATEEHRDSGHQPSTSGYMALAGEHRPDPAPGRVTKDIEKGGGEIWEGRGVSMKKLAQLLSVAYDIRVIDASHQSGVYDFTLRFRSPTYAPPADWDGKIAQAERPITSPQKSLWDALHALGISVAHVKNYPVEVLIIDSYPKAD